MKNIKLFCFFSLLFVINWHITISNNSSIFKTLFNGTLKKQNKKLWNRSERNLAEFASATVPNLESLNIPNNPKYKMVEKIIKLEFFVLRDTVNYMIEHAKENKKKFEEPGFIKSFYQKHSKILNVSLAYHQVVSMEYRIESRLKSLDLSNLTEGYIKKSLMIFQMEYYTAVQVITDIFVNRSLQYKTMGLYRSMAMKSLENMKLMFHMKISKDKSIYNKQFETIYSSSSDLISDVCMELSKS